MTLEAVNTDVTITFKAKGSPFQSGTNRIEMSAGESRNEIVRADAAGSFEYTLSCSECSRQSMADPEMIVP